MSRLIGRASAPIIIGGRERPVDQTRWHAVLDPAHRDNVVGSVALANERDVDDAVAAAAEALPAWRGMTAAERAEAMRDAAEAIEVDLEARARLLTREHGKVLAEAKHDASGAVRILRYYAQLAERFDRPEVSEDQRGRIVRTRRPYGVVAVIVPWNAPIYLGFLMLAPALLAGNTVVVKPAEEVPLALADTLRLLVRSLPPGVVNVVPGMGAETGRALSLHPDVRKISFTGSIATGQSLMRAAATTIKGLSLELGGNDPAVILEGARITDELIAELVRGVYAGSGQICYNVKRIYVHRSHHDDLVTRFTDAVNDIVVGDGLDPASTMGPVTTEAQFRYVTELLERTQSLGGRVRTVGRKLDPAGWDNGLFILPSVVTGVASDEEIVVKEQFGPTVPILPFDEEDEAVALANATEYGLAASVWDEDVTNAFGVADRIDAGSVFVNIHRIGASDVSMEFGGVKQSGVGRGHAWAAVEESSQTKVLAQRCDLSSYGPRLPLVDDGPLHG